ncbi:MAG: triphosphoribosyl-dephospho-CoA synthase [Weeping tea tree witches'-broom phytoplasma]|uniref:triphosphoribosyl-dephospho-CoA synthase n=1 Tax=Candidatus Phytoplasma melaleucae TaxID=2982630 RepID=UPI00293AB7A1|nr:triphosphoribosyl-dephospho-CoA synthase [Weeping tea tree witches'-broom phytoplasma]
MKLLNGAVSLAFLQNKLIDIAIQSIESELLCYPALGLVSYFNCGCHVDMNIATFLKSKHTFYFYFVQINHLASQQSNLNFNQLRIIGIQQEKRMFKSTNNINTHKGLIFVFGIIYYVTLYGLMHRISFRLWQNLVKILAQDVKKDFVFFNNRTKGEKIFQEYGIKGARGEALSGYKNIFLCGFPFAHKCTSKYPMLTKYELYLCLLIFYLKMIDDTTLIMKIGYAKYKIIQKQAALWLSILDEKDFTSFRKEILNKNEMYQKQKISPGGCADLSVVTCFLFFVSSYFKII